MAQNTYPQTMTFGSMVVELGNGDGPPETFATPAGFTSKAFNKSAATSEANIPAVNAPDAPCWTLKGVSALSIEITGSGVVAEADIPTWTAWFLSGATKDVRVVRSGVDYWVGPAVLTAYNETTSKSQDGNLVQISVTIQSAGAWTQTTGAPPN